MNEPAPIPSLDVRVHHRRRGCPVLALFARAGSDAADTTFVLLHKPRCLCGRGSRPLQTAQRTGHPPSCLCQRIQKPGPPALSPVSGSPDCNNCRSHRSCNLTLYNSGKQQALGSCPDSARSRNNPAPLERVANCHSRRHPYSDCMAYKAGQSRYCIVPTGGPLKPGFGLSGDVQTSKTWEIGDGRDVHTLQPSFSTALHNNNPSSCDEQPLLRIAERASSFHARGLSQQSFDRQSQMGIAVCAV